MRKKCLYAQTFVFLSCLNKIMTQILCREFVTLKTNSNDFCREIVNVMSYFLLLHIKGQIINKKSSLINVEELWQKKLI